MGRSAQLYHTDPIEYRVDGRTVTEPARILPVAAQVDVIVSGGGPAGLGAAVGAARQGAKTMLLERNAFLGGSATGALMAIWNMPLERMTGFAHEMTSRLIAGGGAVGGGPATPFDPEHFKRIALEFVQENDIQLLLYTSVVAPIIENGRIRGVVVENKGGRQAILARNVVDCTGDGDLAAAAGVPFVKGRESDGKMRPMTVLMRLGGLDLPHMVDYARAHPEEFDRDPHFQMLDLEHGMVRFAGFFRHVREAHERGELDPSLHYLRFEGVEVGKGMAYLNTVRVYGVDGTDAFDLTRAELEANRQMQHLLVFVKRRIPGCEDCYVVQTSPSIGVRETRRIRGKHVLTEADIAADRTYPDTIARLWRFHTPGVEMHSPDPVEGSPEDPLHRSIERPLISFEVPYGCLLPAEIDGLLVGGRAISQDHAADGWTRGMYACMVTGQAAGTAAGIAAIRNVSASALSVRDLQRALSRQRVDLGSVNTP
jgi:glycine/D-amino acid oxidase-like deaminating enzyme